MSKSGVGAGGARKKGSLKGLKHHEEISALMRSWLAGETMAADLRLFLAAPEPNNRKLRNLRCQPWRFYLKTSTGASEAFACRPFRGICLAVKAAAVEMKCEKRSQLWRQQNFVFFVHYANEVTIKGRAWEKCVCDDIKINDRTLRYLLCLAAISKAARWRAEKSKTFPASEWILPGHEVIFHANSAKIT